MIVYLIIAEGGQAPDVSQCIASLRERDQSCQIAVMDAGEHPLALQSGIDFYRRRPLSRDALEGELQALAAVSERFSGARWIGKVEDLFSPPVLHDGPHPFDFLSVPGGYFVRRHLVSCIVGSQGRGGTGASAVAGMLKAAGGRVEEQQSSAPADDYIVDPVLSQSVPMHAAAFCTVATEGVIDEVEILLRTLRRHHIEPLLVVCDDIVALRIGALGLEQVEIEPITDSLRMHSERISERVIRHHPYWKPEAIALKFHALRTSLQRHGPSHLLDADIAVNASLHTGGPWMADLVLSPHFKPTFTSTDHGFFNAGYLMARDTSVVDRWEEMYAGGIGGFYEQKCLESLSREFVTSWFGPEHNFAQWRQESPSRRTIVSLHHKLVFKQDSRRIADLHKAVRGSVVATGRPRRIAHVHCVRSWGTYLRCLFRERICPALGLQNLVSWDLGLKREWSEAELLLLAEEKLWGQHSGGCGFVHNHTFGWTERALDAFHHHGWLTVALVRDPREVLVSLASWALDAMDRGQPCPVWHCEGIDNSPLSEARTLEEAVTVLVDDPIYHAQWVLPPWLGKVKWIRRADPDAIGELCRGVCGLAEVPELVPAFRNGSSSPGWDDAPLPPCVRKLVNAHPEVEAWDGFLEAL